MVETAQMQQEGHRLVGERLAVAEGENFAELLRSDGLATGEHKAHLSKLGIEEEEEVAQDNIISSDDEDEHNAWNLFLDVVAQDRTCWRGAGKRDARLSWVTSQFFLGSPTVDLTASWLPELGVVD